MKKNFAIAAMSAFVSLGTLSVNAGSWEVLCVKQGAARGYFGNPLYPTRVLPPNLNTNPGNTLGYPIGARSIPTQMKVAEKSDVVGEMNFFSLGFHGEVILKYNNPASQDFFTNVPGEPDLTSFETTWGDPSCNLNSSEQAIVEVSENGVNWVGGAVCHNGDIDMGALLKAKYVRIRDITNPNPAIVGDGVDAYDVDGLEAKADWEPNINPLCDFKQGVARQFVGMGMPPGTGIVPQRKNFGNAEFNDPSFTPAQFANPALREVSGWFNFWSIGFGGYACFQLPRTIFDDPNPANPEFRMFETTWNNKPCPNYPETVLIQTSPDGTNWSAGRLLCKDGTFDLDPDGAGPLLPAYAAVNYIKFTDASNPLAFGRGADSYDIDNIYIGEAASPGDICSDNGQIGRRAVPEAVTTEGQGGIPEEMFALQIVGSNVVNEKISFQATIAEEGGYHYAVRNHTGQEMTSGAFPGGLYESPVAEINTGGFAPGVYFLTLSSTTGRETLKFVKK
jgi:hypothetical protein